MSYSNTPTMINLTPQHSIKGSTIFWISFSCIAAILGFSMFIKPKLFEKSSVAGTCPTGTKCCATCGFDTQKIVIGGVVIAAIIGILVGVYLNYQSKNNGGQGLQQGVFGALTTPR